MKSYVWQEGMSLEEQKDGAYWERNMLALLLANIMNDLQTYIDEELHAYDEPNNSGWYLHGEWEGWSRVISIDKGSITFHVPDDFYLGNLPQIEPNWDGHTTEEKWNNVMKHCGCKVGG